MANKLLATAIIEFRENKDISVKLDTMERITPRMLEIAGYMLERKFREMRGQFLATQHQVRRDAERNRPVDFEAPAPKEIVPAEEGPFAFAEEDAGEEASQEEGPAAEVAVEVPVEETFDPKPETATP